MSADRSPDAGPVPPAPLLAFLDLYGRGEYWESHEVLEGPWRTTRSDFYQGLILYASAWVHWERANAHGVEAQLRKTLGRLDRYPDGYLGLDVAAVRRHCREVRAVVRTETDWLQRTHPLDLRVDPARIRGDEVELETREARHRNDGDSPEGDRDD